MVSTTTLLSANTTTPAFGQQVVLTATLQTSPLQVGALTPTGTVTFFDFGTSIGTAPVSGGIATFNTTSLTSGNHSITASYGGDTNFSPSPASPAFGITVGKATPVITWANPSPITYGTLLSSTQLNATTTVAGTFAYNPSASTLLAIGTYTITATFTPTDSTDYTIATASVTLVVNQVRRSSLGLLRHRSPLALRSAMYNWTQPLPAPRWFLCPPTTTWTASSLTGLRF